MAERIVKAVLNVADSRKASRVMQINLDVGELTFLGHDQLRFGIEVLTKGTIAENARVLIRTRKAKIKCPKCGYVGRADYLGKEIHSVVPIPILTCPKCGSSEAVVAEGNECMVKSIRIQATTE
jgi:hydrogenase nickel incorporation protein HypA/HybF